MQQALQTNCPDQKTLATFVSGSLAEADADRLFLHLEECTHCQTLTDQLAQRSDSLVEAIRHASPESGSNDDGGLAQLISAAQQYDTNANFGQKATTEPNTAASSPTDAIVELDRFTECVGKSGLCDEGEAAALVEETGCDNTLSAARQLVLDDKLTYFQARALVRGRWKGLVLGNYVVLGKVGQGGMGQVYKARHRMMGRTVCLKVLHSPSRRSQQHIERFRREATTIAALNHPNIVVAHDAGDAGGIPYLAMELVEGSDLANYVKKQGPLSPAAAVNLVLQAARALGYAHQQGVIHRDIKPHNLMLDLSGNLKILDLGLARFELDPTEGSAMTQSGVVMGTVDYVAPEQAMNARTADARSDVYALGCTLFFLLTGRTPYGGETPVERLIAHREEPIPSVRTVRPDVSPGLDAIFQRAIAKQPESRYQSMGELAQDLASLESGTLSDEVFEPTPPPISIMPAPSDSFSNLSESDLLRDSDLATLAQFETTQATITLAPVPPRLPKSRRRKPFRVPPKVWPWLAAAGTSVAVLIFISVIVSSLPDGGPSILSTSTSGVSTGGGGQALVVVSPNGFSSEDYSSVTKALKSRGIDYDTASVQGGYAKSSKHEKIPIDVNLKNVSPGDYNTVIYCGGNTHALKGQSEFVKSSLKKGGVVAGVGGGFDAVNDAWHKEGKNWDTINSGYEVKHTKSGHIVKVCDHSGADKALGHVFDKLAKD